MVRQEVAGFLLAGGHSSRMGTDKALLRLGGETLAERGLSLLSAVCAEVAIAGGTAALAGSGRIVPDRHPGCGPLGGIVAALEQSAAEWNLFLAVDMPALPVSALERLLAEPVAGDEVCVMAETAEIKQPLCALYARRALPVLAAELAAGRWKVTAAIAAAGPVRFVQFSEAPWFANANTPEEFAAIAQGAGVIDRRTRPAGIR